MRLTDATEGAVCALRACAVAYRDGKSILTAQEVGYNTAVTVADWSGFEVLFALWTTGKIAVEAEGAKIRFNEVKQFNT